MSNTKKDEDILIDDEINQEKNRLKKIFKNLDANKLKTLDGLMDSAAFMRVTLRDLEHDINVNGYKEEYQNGENQCGVKTTPAANLHLSMTKNYTAVIKILTDAAPPAERKKTRFELMNDE